MHIFFYLSIFSIGAIAGSFVNLLIWRLPRKEDIIKKRSYCPNCKHKLYPLDLVPIFSYLFLGGKCRFCDKKIPIRYFLVEIVLGFLFLGFFLSSFNLLLLSWILSILLVSVFVIDLEHRIIPNELVLGVLAVSVSKFFLSFNLNVSFSDTFVLELIRGLFPSIYFVSNVEPIWLDMILGSLVFSLPLILIYIFTKGKGMGLGDIKLALALGLFLGTPRSLLAIFISFIIGGIVSAFLLIKGDKKFKSKLPFGPFIVFSSILVLFL